MSNYAQLLAKTCKHALYARLHYIFHTFCAHQELTKNIINKLSSVTRFIAGIHIY
jgi:hypothetical protein